MKVSLNGNYGYKWYSNKGIHFKGYIQKTDTLEVLREDRAVSFFSGINSAEELEEKLKLIDGIFSVIIECKEETLAAVDVARSFPIFISEAGDVLSDNIEIVRAETTLDCDINDSAIEELLNDSYIAHTRTAYRNIIQLDAGQIARIGLEGIKQHYYFIHLAKCENIDRASALEKFQDVSNAVFDSILQAAQNRPIAISLSGGYDSRYVACMLKYRGATDVSCYTYGKKDSFEVEQSRLVAEQLGYRWTCVEYTNELLQESFNETFIPFFGMNVWLDSGPYIQNYAAVKTLHEKGWFKPNTVFVTGLCNDMQSGAYVKAENNLKAFNNSKEYLIDTIMKDRNMVSTLSENAQTEYKLELSKTIESMGLKINGYQDFVSACDAIEAIMRHSRFFLHMNDAHGWFGYEWLLPCWNKRSLAFWYSLPANLRVNQNLYEEWITTKVPFEFGVGQKKKRVSYVLYSGADRFKARVRLVVKRLILFPLGMNLKEETDYNNFGFVAAKYFKKIKNKSLIGFRNLQVNRIMTQFYVESMFGAIRIKQKNVKTK